MSPVYQGQPVIQNMAILSRVLFLLLYSILSVSFVVINNGLDSFLDTFLSVIRAH
jgi:hypothetical protein